MNITFTLKRSVTVRRFDLVATIAREAKRAELAPVLQWAKARSTDTLRLDPVALAEELLGPGAGMTTVAKRLLIICRDLRLVDEQFTGLTESGEWAVTSGTILQPEKGEWTIWTAEDPLLRFPIVGVTPKTTEDGGGEREYRQRDGRQTRAEQMPKWVLAAAGSTSPLLQDGRAARFDDIAAPAVESPSTDVLEVRWTIGPKPELRVVGTIGRKKIDQPLRVDSLPSGAAVWEGMLAERNFAKAWDARRMALRVPFAAATTDHERLQMRTELKFPSPTVESCGTFGEVTVTNIPMCPDSDRAASEWAKYQITAQLGGIQTSKVYAGLTDRVRTTFADWRIDVPSREALAEELGKNTAIGTRGRAFWSLQAALDWNL